RLVAEGDGRPAGLLDIAELASSYGGEQSDSHRGAFVARHSDDALAEHIGLHLSPELTFSPSARGADLAPFDAKFLHDGEAVAQGVSHPLEYTPCKVAARMAQGQPHEGPAGQ